MRPGPIVATPALLALPTLSISPLALAEAADEAPAAEVDRRGLEYVVRHEDLGLTWM